VGDERTQAPAAERGDAELEQLRDKWLRARADLDNYRKRSDREVELRYADTRDRLLLDWLDVVDDVDRALRSGSVAEAPLRQLRQRMLGLMERHGVERTEDAGAPFDPEFHEAVGVRETDEEPPGTVVDVVRAGYRIADRVLRPARVIVARRRPADGHGDA
jgi:molecular chaperone GrpE